MKPNPDKGETILELKLDLFICHRFKQLTVWVTAYQTQLNNMKITFKFNARLNMTFSEYTQNWRWCCKNK